MWTWADGCDAFPFSPTGCFCSSTLIPPKRTEVWPPPRSLRPISSKVKPPLNCRPMVALGAGPEAGTPPHSRVEAEQEKSASYLHTLRKGVSQAWRSQSYGREGVLSALALNPWPHSLIVAACASRAASLFHPQPASSGEGTAERELNLLLKV